MGREDKVIAIISLSRIKSLEDMFVWTVYAISRNVQCVAAQCNFLARWSCQTMWHDKIAGV